MIETLPFYRLRLPNPFMKQEHTASGLTKLLEKFAFATARWTSSSWAFLLTITIILMWIISGPFLGFSEHWQFFMNTISSSVTLFMVFLIQRSQNKDTLAMQIKLNEIIAAQHGANNRLISIETLSEEEIMEAHKSYKDLASEIEKTHEKSIHSVSVQDVSTAASSSFEAESNKA